MIIQKPSSFVKLSQVNHMYLFVLIIHHKAWCVCCVDGRFFGMIRIIYN
ncbi:hypothetical protein AO376_1426 [Moraxella catarrhalis]|nr:hypothetical protein AO376_1426 [Moraxella catarrhalis]OAV19560.1 hypothetical protein AO374_0666 [Moraxella catarrhalis]